MVDAWLTTMSTNLEAVINPLIAACEEGFLPDELYVLENPGVGDQFDDITSMMERVVVEYGGEDPDLSVTHLEMETDFQGIVEHFREPIAQIQTDGGTAAVDVTPGRKFMSAIASRWGFSSRPTTSSISMYRTTASTADCTLMSPDQLSNSLTSRRSSNAACSPPHHSSPQRAVHGGHYVG